MAHEGRCSCGKVRFRLTAEPIVTHACHCRQCQRITGSAFMMNTVVETDALEVLSGDPASTHFEGTSHTSWFCQDCGTYVWSHFGGRFDGCRFVRVGTMDDPDAFPPDVQIFTDTKQPWVVLSDNIPQFAESYEWEDVLSPKRLSRLKAVS